MRSSIAGSAVSLLAAISACAPARADEPWMFAQVTCAPTLGYFSIRRITIMNLPNMGPYLTEGLNPSANVKEALRRENGIFDIDGLEREPFTCSIAKFKPPTGWGAGERLGFDVKVVGLHDHNSEESSDCNIADDAEVYVNGKSIGLLTLNACGRDEATISIELSNDGLELSARKCIQPSMSEDPAGNRMNCSEGPVGGSP